MPIGLNTNITQTGNGENLYAIAGSGGGGGVNQLIAGTNITLNPPSGLGSVIINSVSTIPDPLTVENLNVNNMATIENALINNLGSPDAIISNLTIDNYIYTPQITNLTGTFGTNGQILSHDGSKIVWINSPVLSLNTVTGAMNLVSSDNTLTITPNQAGNEINLQVPAVDIGVVSLNTVTGAMNLISSNNTLTINPNQAGNEIDLLVPVGAGGVASINTFGGVVTLDSDNVSIVVANNAGTITLTSPLAISADANANTALINANTAIADALAAQTTADAALALATTADATANSALAFATTADATANSALALATTADAGVVAIVASYVTSVNSGTGAISINAGSGITVGTSGSTITIANSGSSNIDINGLLNKINAFPVLPYTASTSSTPSTNQTATAIVPDETPPVNVPTVGAVQGGWGFSKAIASGATFNWYMYNPRFGLPAAPLPYIKSKIQSVWALIRPTVNLYLAGYLGLNLYTYDNANPPTTGFFNTRWSYSNSSGLVAGATGVNLFAGYTYLIYANDTPRITNSSAIGVPDSQISGLRDPYDIYTDVNHIALSNCIVAFNPWTDGTNFRTWTSTGVFAINDTIVFAGFGTNFNGLFFIATGVPVVGVAPMVNGVISANWALINPQPSTYANQPVLSMNINQSSASSQAVGYVVLDMGFSYGTSTTSTTVSEHISLLPN